MNRIRSHLTYANVMATLAVFLVLGGAAYASFHLPRNSVRSRNIKNGQVRNKDLADHAVTGQKLAPPSAWHEVSPLDTRATSVSWTNIGEGSETAAYYRDPFGVVRLKGTVQCPNNGSTKAIFRLPQGFRPGRSSALPGHPVLGRDDGHRVGVAEGVATSGLRDQPLKPREHQRSRSVPSSHAGLRSAVAPKEGPRLLRPPWSRTDESVNFQRLFSFVSSGQGEVPGGGPQGRGTPWLRRDPQARPLRPELAVHSSLASLALTSGRLLSDRISPLGLARRLRSSGIHPPRGRLSPRRVIGGRRAVGRPPGAFFHSEPPAVVF